MSAVVDPIVTSLRGDALAVAERQRIELHLFDKGVVEDITAPFEVTQLGVNASGDTLVVAGRDSASCWRRGRGFTELVRRVDARSRFAAGVVDLSGATYLLVYRHGALHVMLDDRVIASVDTGPRPAFEPKRFVQLDGEVLAIVGHHPDDPYPAYATVHWDRLLADPSSLQSAIERGPRDQAWYLQPGPAGPDELVAYRDPQDLELPEDDDGTQPLWGMRGAYVRALASGTVVARFPLDTYDDVRGIAGTSTTIVLSRDRYLITIDRASGAIASRSGEAIALDPQGRGAAVREQGTWTRVEL